MTEVTQPGELVARVEDEETTTVATPAAPPTAGRLLREAREAMQVDVAVLAAMLKVPEHKLRALEADQLDALPDLTFARALAASVCRTLQIDPEPVMALLPRSAAAPVRSGIAPLNAPYRTQNETTVAARASAALQGRYLWAVLALLLAAVVLALLPNLDELRLPGREASVTHTPMAQAPSAPQAVASEAAAPEAMPTASDAATAPATAAASAAVTAASEAASAAVNAGPDLRLSTNKDAWVQVRDARDKTLISRTLRPGEAVDLTGQPPYRVVIGNIEGVSFTVRGQPFDLRSVTQGTTARFEVP